MIATTTKLTPDHVAHAQQLRARGLSYEAIGETLGVDASTVRRKLNPAAARKTLEYNRSRRVASTGARRAKTGHQFPWEGVE